MHKSEVLRGRGAVEMNTEVKVVGEVSAGKRRLCRQQERVRWFEKLRWRHTNPKDRYFDLAATPRHRQLSPTRLLCPTARARPLRSGSRRRRGLRRQRRGARALSRWRTQRASCPSRCRLSRAAAGPCLRGESASHPLNSSFCSSASRVRRKLCPPAASRLPAAWPRAP